MAGAIALGSEFATVRAAAGPVASAVAGVAGSVIGFTLVKGGAEALLDVWIDSGKSAVKYSFSVPTVISF